MNENTSSTDLMDAVWDRSKDALSLLSLTVTLSNTCFLYDSPRPPIERREELDSSSKKLYN